MSIIFDARKSAEHSKQARDAVADVSRLTDDRLRAADSPDAAPAEPGSESNSERLRAVERPRASVADDASNTALLGLRIERHGQDWRVTWNKELSAASAQGRLSFTDGVTREDLELRGNELKSGMVTYSYSPVNDRVFLRLELIDRDLRSITESAHLDADSTPTLRTRMPRRTVSQGQRSRSRGGRSNPVNPVDSPESPAGQDVAVVRSLLRKPRAEPVFGISAPGSKQGGTFEPAKLLVSSNPIYPGWADQSFVSERVEVSFRISPEGKVYNTRWIKGSPLLAQAATESVESWLYEPARLNGAPIDSQGTATVEFKQN